MNWIKVIKLSFDVKIVFDNKCVKEGFLSGFGFSALIYNHFTKSYLLFDTGEDSRVLFHNIKQFKIPLPSIDKVIISHNHYDHNGALGDFYSQNSNVDLYIPDGLENYIYQFPEARVHLFKAFTEISLNIYVSGQFGSSIKEQALLLKTKENAFIMIVGCTHPGLEHFIAEAKKILPINAIIGGFHGFRKYSYLDGIKFIGACHCTVYTGDIKKRFPNEYKKISVGDSYSF